MAKRVRRKFSDTEKINTVGRIRSGVSTIMGEVKRLNCSRTVIDRWVKDPRFKTSRALPTKAAAPTRAYKRKTPTRKAPQAPEVKAVITTVGECPHCGGQLDLRKAA